MKILSITFSVLIPLVCNNKKKLAHLILEVFLTKLRNKDYCVQSMLKKRCYVNDHGVKVITLPFTGSKYLGGYVLSEY